MRGWHAPGEAAPLPRPARLRRRTRPGVRYSRCSKNSSARGSGGGGRGEGAAPGARPDVTQRPTCSRCGPVGSSPPALPGAAAVRL